jgi:hypothetical protein
MSNGPSTTKSVEQRETTRLSADPWRYRCPNGHASWEGFATSDDYHCKTCGVRFSKDELVDMREESTGAVDYGEWR